MGCVRAALAAPVEPGGARGATPGIPSAGAPGGKESIWLRFAWKALGHGGWRALIGPKHKGAPPTEPFEEIMEKAQAALSGGDATAAERLFGNATVVKPASAAAWLGKGRAFAAQASWDKALRCFSIAVKFDPKGADAWAGRAEAWLHMGQKEKARADLGALEALDAGHADLKRLRAQVG